VSERRGQRHTHRGHVELRQSGRRRGTAVQPAAQSRAPALAGAGRRRGPATRPAPARRRRVHQHGKTGWCLFEFVYKWTRPQF